MIEIEATHNLYPIIFRLPESIFYDCFSICFSIIINNPASDLKNVNFAYTILTLCFMTVKENLASAKHWPSVPVDTDGEGR